MRSSKIYLHNIHMNQSLTRSKLTTFIFMMLFCKNVSQSQVMRIFFQSFDTHNVFLIVMIYDIIVMECHGPEARKLVRYSSFCIQSVARLSHALPRQTILCQLFARFYPSYNYRTTAAICQLGIQRHTMLIFESAQIIRPNVPLMRSKQPN